MTEKNTVNLTIPMLIWAVAFVGVGIATDDAFFYWLAALPILVFFLFFAFFVGMGLLGILVAYMSGEKIQFKTPSGKIRYYQRKR